jgi:hypothetical protein
MTKVIVDEAMLAKLHNLDAPLEICDTLGRTVGFFHPAVGPGTSNPRAIRSPVSDDELQQRRKQRTGKTLAEVLNQFRD